MRIYFHPTENRGVTIVYSDNEEVILSRGRKDEIATIPVDRIPWDDLLHIPGFPPLARPVLERTA